MKLRDLLAGVPLTGGNADLNMEINSISYDSRTLEPGALFVALSASKTDGHRPGALALETCAAAILCREPPRTGSWLSTPDPRAALARVSAAWFGYPGEEMTLIGVTGTNGKTTTTYLIKAMLEGALKTRVGLIGTNRNLIGALELPAHRTTPEPYELQALLRRMADAGCTHVVMEVSSHALAQSRVEGLTFQAGVFTNLTQDHLDYHGTMEAYRRAKGRLFRQSERAVLNLDDEAGRWYRERIACPSLTYSENKDTADLTAKNIRLFPGHVEFEAVARGQITRVHLPIPGGFTIYNALAALACGLCLDIPLDKAAAPLRAVRGVKGRVEVVPVPTAYTVIIDYAHTPDALENILTTARDFTAGRLICVFGASAPSWGRWPPSWLTWWWSPLTTHAPRGRRISSRISCRAWRGWTPSATWSPTVRRPSAGPCPRRARGTWSCWLERGMRPIRRSTASSTTWTSGKSWPAISAASGKAREKSRDRGQKTVEKSLRMW